MKLNLIDSIKYAVVIVILAVMVWNELREEHVHDNFFGDVRPTLKSMDDFMKSGGRNTAKQGYDLCVELDEFKAIYHHHHGEKYEPKSCEDIYNINAEEK